MLSPSHRLPHGPKRSWGRKLKDAPGDWLLERQRVPGMVIGWGMWISLAVMTFSGAGLAVGTALALNYSISKTPVVFNALRMVYHRYHDPDHKWDLSWWNRTQSHQKKDVAEVPGEPLEMVLQLPPYDPSKSLVLKANRWVSHRLLNLERRLVWSPEAALRTRPGDWRQSIAGPVDRWLARNAERPNAVVALAVRGTTRLANRNRRIASRIITNERKLIHIANTGTGWKKRLAGWADDWLNERARGPGFTFEMTVLTPGKFLLHASNLILFPLTFVVGEIPNVLSMYLAKTSGDLMRWTRPGTFQRPMIVDNRKKQMGIDVGGPEVSVATPGAPVTPAITGAPEPQSHHLTLRRIAAAVHRPMGSHAVSVPAAAPAASISAGRRLAVAAPVAAVTRRPSYAEHAI